MTLVAWEICRAWCWATGDRPPVGALGPWDDPAFTRDLDELLAEGWEPLAYVPSLSAFGGRMILRRRR